jgi:hypothetical protein
LPVGLNIVFRFVIVGGVLGLVWTWWLYGNFGLAPQFWAGVLVYGLCCELYVFLFTLAMSSISANLLVSLSRRAMTAAEIEQLYDSRAMVSSRIDRLVAVGLFERSGGSALFSVTHHPSISSEYESARTGRRSDDRASAANRLVDAVSGPCGRRDACRPQRLAVSR